MEILLSVALVTRNRPERLKSVLKSLFNQRILPFEVIISDDSDSEQSIALNKELSDIYSCKYITGPRKGLYANRNFGAKHCTGTHIRTMDDDHEFPENHLQLCLDAIRTDYDAVWVIGEYTHLDEQRPLPPPVPGQLHPRGFSYKPKDMNRYFGISCGASIYPKSVITNEILNLENYKFGILYLEYGARLYNSGYRINFLDTTYIIHNSYDTSAPSAEVVNGAKVFSMLMFSFFHNPLFFNKLKTILQIAIDLSKNRYSTKLFIYSYNEFKFYSTALKP
ncbi:glycosyltransferase family 2 protein [Hymenobacter norwichensis]|uniref:glycosyltransferase family 2 protein n=1 Tax=Hymenobacter norwichensis TaxID=223903 RepID=UPI0003F88C4F|nr:glycosyltransferase family 2 protein [Hymenobacter norwichensis]